MARRTRRRAERVAERFFVSICAIALSSQARSSDDEDAKPAAVPNRPTVSTTAALSAPGWLEGELGGLYLRDRHPDADPVRRVSVPYSIKLAFSENWGVRIDGEGLVRQTANDGTRDTGFGDTTFILKRRFGIDAASAFGLEGGVTVPTAQRGLGLGSGKPDYVVNAIYSSDFGDWHADVNLSNTRLGAIDRDAGEGRWQTLGAVAVSRPLTERWGFAAEISGTHQRGANGTAQALGAFTYAIRPSMVLDFGVAHALNRATPTWQVFGGITMVLARVW